MPQKQKYRPHLQLQQELLHALTLFGRLSGTEWSAVAVVMELTLGWCRTSAPIGTADFRDRIRQPAEKPEPAEKRIRRALQRLSAPAGERVWDHPSKTDLGHGVLRIVRESTPTTERWWAVEDDWSLWGWVSDEHRVHATLILSAAYPEFVPVAGHTAIGLAEILRQHCLNASGEFIDVPPADDQHRSWHRWCASMNELAAHHDRQIIIDVMDRAFEQDCWRAVIQGRHADQQFVRYFDIMRGLR